MGMSEGNEVEDEMDLEQYEGYVGDSWFWGDYTKNGYGIHLNGSKILPNGKEEVIPIADIEIQFIEIGPDGASETGPTHKLIRDAPDLLAALKQERSRHLEALCWQNQRYAAIRHWIADNHPEVNEAYMGAFYTITDNSFEEIPDDGEYTGCEGYPRYGG